MADSLPGDRPFEITDELVTALIQDQFPDLAHLDIGRHYTLEDHTSVRVGDEYGAIFPTVPNWDINYARNADFIKPLLPLWDFPWSAPLRTGEPGHGYPYHWVISKWISASTAGFVPLRPEAAAPLGDALRQIHQAAPADAPASPTTDVTIEGLTPEWHTLLESVAAIPAPEHRLLDTAAATALWASGAHEDAHPRRTWTHGNLEPHAIMSNQGQFAGIVLWHTFGVGNPAVDLGAACIVIPTDARATMLKAYGKVNAHMLAAIQSYELLAALRYIEGDNPFLSRLAWERLIELGVAKE
jgi:aminoglycoside phosphotransferase (APT) family kinase protein